MTPDEEAAARVVAAYGERANQIVNELVKACLAEDPRRGGELVREAYATPDLLLLVVGMLTTGLVKGMNGAMAPLVEEPETEPTEIWQVAVKDQMAAAVDHKDMNEYARLAVDAQIRTLAAPFTNPVDVPDTEQLVRTYAVLDRLSVMACAAEGLRRLVVEEVKRRG